jgi:c-di-GMP-binding flagellar brake protein YcgR
MTHPSWGTIMGATTDISDGGAHVSFENAVAPPVGTEMSVTFKKVVGNINDEPVRMMVVRSDKNSLALMFSPR